MTGAPCVLIVEDDAHIRDLVVLHLQLEGFDTATAGDGREALRLFAETAFDCVVLDLMIPGLDGLTVCRAIRQGATNTDVPILILTARREETDKVLGLESGADDYLTKPFGVREFVARVRALMRRRRPAAAGVKAEPTPFVARHGQDERTAAAGAFRDPAEGASRGLSNRPGSAIEADRPIVVHDVEIDPARRRVRVAGSDVTLTNQEFHLLHLLATHPGIVFSREALLARIWKNETFVTERSVDTLVKRLRRKIEDDAANPRLILTVWGAGYKFADV
jgi:two-component system OmpR family response regulator/two-component system alkaline phosphatase synthesis response regulator PhoP